MINQNDSHTTLSRMALSIDWRCESALYCHRSVEWRSAECCSAVSISILLKLNIRKIAYSNSKFGELRTLSTVEAVIELDE